MFCHKLMTQFMTIEQRVNLNIPYLKSIQDQDHRRGDRRLLFLYRALPDPFSLWRCFKTLNSTQTRRVNLLFTGMMNSLFSLWLNLFCFVQISNEFKLPQTAVNRRKLVREPWRVSPPSACDCVRFSYENKNPVNYTNANQDCLFVCLCVCGCVCEREKERECVFLWLGQEKTDTENFIPLRWFKVNLNCFIAAYTKSFQPSF